MKKKEKNFNNRSLITVFIYVAIVILVILIALSVRLYYIIQASKFDGQHRFSLAISENSKVYEIISFEPRTYSLSVLSFSNDSYIPLSSLAKTTGIFTDGFINTKYKLNLNSAIPSLFQSLIFHNNQIVKNITIYDLAQFWYFSTRIPQSTISYKQISNNSDPAVFDNIAALLFSDSELSGENLSIQIINATGKSGLGARLERALSNLGGNVVSVRTAAQTENLSMIQYSDNINYTVKKIESVLLYPLKKMKKTEIADIVIQIGKKNMNTAKF